VPSSRSAVTAGQAEELVELISGHGLRAGYAISAAARNMPAYRIQSHTRQVVAGYIREAEKRTKSGLDGCGVLNQENRAWQKWVTS
jgi:hypothetical protein